MSQNTTIKTPQDYVNYTFNINARGIAEVSGELMGLSNTVTNILGQIAFKTSEFLAHTEMLAIGAGAAVSATFVKATKDAIRFEQQVANVKAIGGESVDANLIGSKAMEYSNKFGMATSQMTEGLEALARAGITTTSVMAGVLEEGVKLSKLEGIDLEESINDLISTTNLLSQQDVDMNAPEYAEMLKAMNQHIVSTSESAPINAQNIIQTLQHVGGYASASGMDQDDLFAVIAQLGARGTKGEMAGTALRAFIAAGQKDTAQRALARIGLNVSDLWDENGETMLPISEMKNVLDEALEARGYSKQEKLEFYSDFAGYKQANQIMKINTKEVQEYKEQIADAWDLGQKLDTILGTVRGNLDRIWQITQNFMTKVGGKMLKIANVMLTPIRKILEIFTKIPFADTGTAVVMMFVGFRTLLSIFTKIVPAVGAFMSHSRDSKEYAKGIRGEWEKTLDLLKLTKEISSNITHSQELTKIHYRERGLSAEDKVIIEDQVAGQMYMDKEMYREHGLAWEDLPKPVKNMIIAEFRQTDEFEINYKEYIRRTRQEVQEAIQSPIVIADFSGTDELEAINTYVQYIFDLLAGRRTRGAENRTPSQNDNSSSGNRERNRRINEFRMMGDAILSRRSQYGDYNWKSSIDELWDPVASTNLDDLYRLQDKINNQIDKKIDDYIEFNSRNLNATGKARVQKSLTRTAMSNFGIAFSTYANTSDIRHFLETGERRSSTGQLFTTEQLLEALRVMNVSIGSNDTPDAELIYRLYQEKKNDDAQLLDKISNATQKIWHQKQSTRTDVSYFPTRALEHHQDVANKLMELVGANSISQVQGYFSSGNVDPNILEKATKIMADNHAFMDEIVKAEITYMYENLARVQNTILKMEQNNGPRGHASTGRMSDAQIKYEYQRLQKSDYYLAEAGKLNMIGKPSQSNDRLAMFQQYGNLAIGGQGYNRRDTLGREDGYGHITISPGTIKFYADNEKFDYDNGYGNLLLETIVHEMGHVLADHSIRESAAYQAMTGKGITDVIDTSTLDLGYDSNFVAEYESNYIAIKTLEKLGLQASSIAYERMNKFKTIIDRHQLQGVDLELADSIVDTLLNNREMLMNYVTSLSTQFDMTAANTNTSEVQENLRPVLTALQNTKQNTTLSGHLNAGGQNQANSIVLLLQARDSAARDGDNELAAAIQELIEEKSTDMANSVQVIKKIKNKKDRDRAKKVLETVYASNDITKPIFDSWLYFKLGEGRSQYKTKLPLETFYEHIKKTYDEQTALAAKEWVESASQNTKNLLVFNGTGMGTDITNIPDIIHKWHDLRKQFAYYEDIELPSGEVIQLPVHKQFAQYGYTHDADGNLVTKFAQKYMHKHSANDPRAFEGIVDILDTDKIRKLSRKDQEFLWKTILKGENREMYDVLEKKDFNNPIFQKLMDSDGKLGDGWAALNITTAMDCLGRLEDGTCDFCDACYAYGQAAMLPEQAVKQIAKSILFANTSVEEFVDILEKQNVKVLRFNQEGDFRDKADYEKTEAIAKLAHERGLETQFYSYTKNKEVLEHIRKNGTPINYQMQDSLDESSPKEHGVANYRAAPWEEMLQSLKDGYRLCGGACEGCEQCLRNFNKVTILRDGSDRKGLGVGVITKYLGGYHNEHSHKKHIEFFTAAQMWEEKEGRRISFDNVGKKFLEQIRAGATANEVIDNYYKEQAETNKKHAEVLKSHASKGNRPFAQRYYMEDSTYGRLWDASIYFKGVKNKRVIDTKTFFKLIEDAAGEEAAEFAQAIFEAEYSDTLNDKGKIVLKKLHDKLASSTTGYDRNPIKGKFIDANTLLQLGGNAIDRFYPTHYWNYIPGITQGKYDNVIEFLAGIIKGEVAGINMNTPLFKLPDSETLKSVQKDNINQLDIYKFASLFSQLDNFDIQNEIHRILYGRDLPQPINPEWDYSDFYRSSISGRLTGDPFLVSPKEVLDLIQAYPDMRDEMIEFLMPYVDARQKQEPTLEFFKNKGIENDKIVALSAPFAFLLGKPKSSLTQHGDWLDSPYKNNLGPKFIPTLEDAIKAWNIIGPLAALSGFHFLYDETLLPIPENSFERIMLGLIYGKLGIEKDALGSYVAGGRGIALAPYLTELNSPEEMLETFIHEFTHMALQQDLRNDLDESHPLALPNIQTSYYVDDYKKFIADEFESNWIAYNVFKRLGLDSPDRTKSRIKSFYNVVEKRGKADIFQWDLYDAWIDNIIDNIEKFIDVVRAFDLKFGAQVSGPDLFNQIWDAFERKLNIVKEDTEAILNIPFVMTQEIRDFINNQTSTQANAQENTTNANTYWEDKKRRANEFWAEQERLEQEGVFWHGRRQRADAFWAEQQGIEDTVNWQYSFGDEDDFLKMMYGAAQQNIADGTAKQNNRFVYRMRDLKEEINNNKKIKDGRLKKAALKGLDWTDKGFRNFRRFTEMTAKDAEEKSSNGELYGKAGQFIREKTAGLREFNDVLSELSKILPILTPAVMVLTSALEFTGAVSQGLTAAQLFLAAAHENSAAATLLESEAESGNAAAKWFSTVMTWKESESIIKKTAAQYIIIIMNYAEAAIKKALAFIMGLSNGQLLLLGGAIAAITIAIGALYLAEKNHAKALKEATAEQEKTTKAVQASYVTYENLHNARINETDAMKRQQIARKESIALYNLEADRIKNLNAINKKSELRGDKLWGEYGARANYQKMGWVQAFFSGNVIGLLSKYLSGDFESQYEQYEGSTGEIRRIREDALGNLMANSSQRTVAKWYDSHKIQLGQIEAFSSELQDLYDKESGLIAKYGSIEEARASEEFAKAVQEFADATGLNRETAEKYLDYLQTERNVENARKVMEAEVNAITARADANAMKAIYGDAAGMGDLSSIQDAMIYATANQIFKDAMHEMWWKQLMEWLTAIYDVLTFHWKDAGKHANAAREYQKGMKELTESQKDIVKDGFDVANANERGDYGNQSYEYDMDTPFGGAVASMEAEPEYAGIPTKSAKYQHLQHYSDIQGRKISHSKIDTLLNRYQHRVDFAAESRTQDEILQVNKQIYQNTNTIAKGYDLNQWYASGHNNGDNSLSARFKNAMFYDRGIGLPPGIDPDDPAVQEELSRRRQQTTLRLGGHGISGVNGRPLGVKGIVRNADKVLAKILDPSNVNLLEEILPDSLLKYVAKYSDDITVKGGKAVATKGPVRAITELATTGISKIKEIIKPITEQVAKVIEKIGLKGAGKAISKTLLKAAPYIGPLVTAAFSIAEHNPFEKHYNEDGSEKRALQSTGEVVGEISGSILALGLGLLSGPFAPIVEMGASLILEPLGKAVGGMIGWVGDEIFNNVLGFVFGSEDKEEQINPSDIANQVDPSTFDSFQHSFSNDSTFKNLSNDISTQRHSSTKQTPIVINIENININTNDDPEKIKDAFMDLMIELSEQVTPRTVSRTIGKINNSTEAASEEETTDENTNAQNNTTDFHGSYN